MNGTAHIIIPPASGRCNLLIDPLQNNCSGLLSNQQERAANYIHRYICLNNKRSWIKISLLIHIIPAAMEPDNGSLL